jgi:hypothetical protein
MDARAVQDGVIGYAQKAASGGIPGLDLTGPSYGDYKAAGVDPWNSGGVDMRQVSASNIGLGQGMQALGAGLGIFANAYESGSPLGGAVSGALGGWAAGASIGAVGGPLGALAGAAVGPIGGRFGSKERMKA